jgi:hypothetical protein
MANGYSYITLINNTIAYNISSEIEGGGLSTQGAFAEFSGKNNIIYFNEPSYKSQYTAIYNGGETNFTYTCISQKINGKGNISDDPLFVNPGKDNFRLKKDSPCINAGNPDNYRDREKDSTSTNMGAL